MKRVIFDIILFISVFIFPWWISALMLLVGIFIFNNFYEFIVASVINFSLYSTGDSRIISSVVYFPLIIITIYITIQFIKSNIILYKNNI
ncbi:MAG: hypothetical protein JJE53_00135 [Candidatus Pacebacteria bacterium]|nr:hypothetical protein [Candidatus Paceibacterota bacterium]